MYFIKQFSKDFISGFKQTLKLKMDGIFNDDRNFQNTENTKGIISLGGWGFIPFCNEEDGLVKPVLNNILISNLDNN